jgi:mannitol/fructose-specific phosphotransferase system IIA component (Ntr-type)/predicted transcriptional regulator
MVPWARVGCLSAAASLEEVRGQIAKERYSRWPVVDAKSPKPSGYLLAKDLIVHQAQDEWKELIRPLKSIHPDDTIDATLTRMQEEGASIYLIEDAKVVLGIITLEDILEQVVGQLEDEDDPEKPLLLVDAVMRGGIVGEMQASTRDPAIGELVSAVDPALLPAGMDHAKLLASALAREEEISTDLGNGIAIPHARCPGLSAPLVVMGRSRDGIVYSSEDSPLVRLAFLLVTPAEKPDVQLALLRQIARMADKAAARDSLMNADSGGEMMDVIRKSG